MHKRLEGRERRRLRIRRKISGTTERPRLSVFRSAKHIYAQVIDDATGRTLAAASTLSAEFAAGGEAQEGDAGKIGAARRVGALVAKVCLAKDIPAVVFDRGGYLYHGRVKALAEGARAAGLNF